MRGWRTTWMVLLGAALAAACNGKEPTCPTGQTLCGGVCVDTATDPNNCRFCGVRCPTGASCIASFCQCPAGLDPCRGACMTLDTDADCGACDHACGMGTCGGTPPACTCTAPAISCGDTVSPECVDVTANDPSNCGACGVGCGHGICEGTPQLCTCDAGYTRCDAANPRCVDLQTDPRHCGDCATACGTGQVCSAGHCCGPGETWCGTACVNTLTDENNCGGCATTCGAPCVCGGSETCSVGHCCGTGLTWCNACVNTNTDTSNCGICGLTCGAGQSCSRGVCCAGAVCGSPPVCCQGTACCSGDVCQPAHPNGLGQSYYDCSPLGTPGTASTYTFQMAQEAAVAWSGAGTPSSVFCNQPELCFGWTKPGPPADCAVWCYAGVLAGTVGHSGVPTGACTTVCPIVGGGGNLTWR